MQSDDIAAPNLEALRKKLVRALQTTHALEAREHQALEGYADDMREAPLLHERLVEHLAETQRHRETLEQRLAAYGGSPSAVKDTLEAMAGRIAGATSGLRQDAVARDAQDVYITEHAEIACYATLITTARAYGDGETVRVCETNLRDEVRMARWLEEHLPEALLLAYERDGITVPGPVAEEAVAAWRAAWQGASWAAQSVIPPGSPTAIGLAPDITGVTPWDESAGVPAPEPPTTQATQP